MKYSRPLFFLRRCSMGIKEVRFDLWCKNCKYFKDSEFDVNSPCFDCLAHPGELDSTKPVNFIKKETKKQ